MLCDARGLTLGSRFSGLALKHLYPLSHFVGRRPHEVLLNVPPEILPAPIVSDTPLGFSFLR